MQAYNLDCKNVPEVRKDGKPLTFWNEEGDELFVDEDPYFFYILDRIKNIPSITENKIRQLITEPLSLPAKIRDKDIFIQIDTRIPFILK